MKKIIALDIGGTNFRGALFDENLNFLKRQTYKTKINSIDDFREQTLSLIDELIDSDVASISIGLPGVIENDSYIKTLPNMGIHEYDLGSVLKEKYNCKISIKNDALVAAVGEANLGVGKDYDSLFFLTVSTGVGGAFAKDGHFEPSIDEIGHTIISYKGNEYEFEQLCSGKGMVRLCALNGLNLEHSKDMFLLKDNGDELAQKCYKDWLELFGLFLGMIKEKVNPSVIAFTGGVFKSKDSFLEDFLKLTDTKMCECKLGEDAGIIGAAVVGKSLLQ